MLEPVLALHLQRLDVNPARIGLVFGCAAAVLAILHPLYGRLSDRFGARRLTVWGLVLSACVMPLASLIVGFASAIPIFVVQTAAIAMVISPSLAYMAEATSSAGLGSFGVAYGLYNVAWGVGLLVGPAARRCSVRTHRVPKSHGLVVASCAVADRAGRESPP